MKMAQGQTLQVSSINLTDRLWLVSMTYVEALAELIQESGLPRPIVLRERRRDGLSGAYNLVVGAHQLAAVKQLGWTELRLGEEAIVLGRGNFDPRALDVSDNIARHELSALDLAFFLYECKGLYEGCNDVAGLGGDRKSQKFKERDIAEPFPLFAARHTGYSESAIRKYLRIPSRLEPSAIPAIRGSLIEDSYKELLALSRLSPDDQLRAIVVIAAGGGRTVAEAIRQR